MSTLTTSGGGVGTDISSSFGSTTYTPDEHTYISTLLERRLAASEVSFRPGPNGKRLAYIEVNKAIELSNFIFNYNGWSSSIVDVTLDYCDERNGRYFCGVSAIVRVTLKDGSFHEDIGYGNSMNEREKASGLDKAKKEAVSDALKRTLRLFGNGLGNCLYDKEFLKQAQSGNLKFEALELNTAKRPKFDCSVSEHLKRDAAIANETNVSNYDPMIHDTHHHNNSTSPFLHNPTNNLSQAVLSNTQSQATSAYTYPKQPSSATSSSSSHILANVNSSSASSIPSVQPYSSFTLSSISTTSANSTAANFSPITNPLVTNPSGSVHNLTVKREPFPNSSSSVSISNSYNQIQTFSNNMNFVATNIPPSYTYSSRSTASPASASSSSYNLTSHSYSSSIAFSSVSPTTSSNLSCSNPNPNIATSIPTSTNPHLPHRPTNVTILPTSHNSMAASTPPVSSSINSINISNRSYSASEKPTTFAKSDISDDVMNGLFDNIPIKNPVVVTGVK